jgi:hypothetical protein
MMRESRGRAQRGRAQQHISFVQPTATLLHCNHDAEIFRDEERMVEDTPQDVQLALLARHRQPNQHKLIVASLVYSGLKIESK